MQRMSLPAPTGYSNNKPPRAWPVSKKAHWDRVYRDKQIREISRYLDAPNISLTLIERPGLKKVLIDVGGGASSLIDHLL